MEIDDLVLFLYQNVLPSIGSDDLKTRLDRVYEGPLTIRDLLPVLIDINDETEKSVDKIVRSWSMDFTSPPLTPGESLMLRLDWSLARLPLLAQAQGGPSDPYLDIVCSKPEEAVIWALCSFWMFSSQWALAEAADSICSGKRSFI